MSAVRPSQGARQRDQPRTVARSKRRQTWFVTATPFALCVALYAPAMQGHFLSDDMAVLFVLSGWHEHGNLWSELAQKFAAGLDAQSHYYRPLPFLSYGINLALPGATDPVAWHVINLGGHLLGGVAVHHLCRMLEPPEHRSTWAPAFVAALFLLCGTSAEAVAWISGRYDVFATAALLWAGVFFLRSERPFDRRACVALACGAAALASKESGAMAPVFVACLAWVRARDAVNAVTRVRQVAVDVAPWVALIVSYFLWRRYLFGNALQVYPGAHPLERLRGGDWFPAPDAIGHWLAAALPDRGALIVLAAAAVAFGGLAIIVVAHDRALRSAVSGMLAAACFSLLLLLPHLSGLPANGEGGRLLYTTVALLAVSSGLVASALETSWSPRRAARIVLAAACVTVIASNARLLDASLAVWRAAGGQMTLFVQALGTVAANVPKDGYVFVVAPDAIRAAPFARNAQGAVMIPPIQAEWLLDRAIVYTPDDLASLPERLTMPVIPILKRLRRNAAGDQLVDASPVPSAPTLVLPSALYCWDADDARLRAATPIGDAPANASHWLSAARIALVATGCRDGAGF